MDEARLEAIEWLLAWVIGNTRPLEMLDADSEALPVAITERVPSPVLSHLERIVENAIRSQRGLPLLRLAASQD